MLRLVNSKTEAILIVVNFKTRIYYLIATNSFQYQFVTNVQVNRNKLKKLLKLQSMVHALVFKIERMVVGNIVIMYLSFAIQTKSNVSFVESPGAAFLSRAKL